MDPTQVVQEVLIAGLSKLKISGDYSDLTISCGEKEFKVHRAVICPRSDFFDRACKGNFKEATTRKVELNEIEPKLVEQLIEYFYTLDYNDGIGVIERGPDGAKIPAFHLEWYASNLAIDMHATADKYAVEGLRELATDKLETIMAAFEWGSWKMDEFVAIADQVYEKTRSADRMREVVKTRALRDLDKLVERTSFQDLVAKEPELAVDLLTACSKFVKGHTCRTDNCGVSRRVFMMVDSCGGCGDDAYTLHTHGLTDGAREARWTGVDSHAGSNGAAYRW